MKTRRAWDWFRGELWDLKEEDSIKFDDELTEIEKGYWDNKNKVKRKQS